MAKGKTIPRDTARKTSYKGPASPAVASEPPPEGLTQEEIAARVGCAQATVSRAVKRGTLVPLMNGRLPEDAVDALRLYLRAEVEEDAEKSKMEARLLAAETGEREAKAELARLRLERESGRFVELAEVERSGADAVHRILAVLRAIPQRTALELDAALSVPAERRAAAVEKIVSREVERAVGEMRESLYLQAAVPWAPTGEHA